MACGDLSDEEWSVIEPHLPRGGRGPIPNFRRQFNVVCGGNPGEDGHGGEDAWVTGMGMVTGMGGGGYATGTG
jgi:hypothetical protein